MLKYAYLISVSRRRMLMATAGVIVLAVCYASIIAAHMPVKTNGVSAKPTASTHKVISEAEATKPDQKEDSTATAGATREVAPKPTTPSATPSKPADSKTVVAPVPSQPNPGNVPVTYVQPQYDTVVQGATLSLGPSACQSGGRLMYGFSYAVSFNGSNKGGVLNLSFEYEQASQAVPGIVGVPYLEPVKFSPATVQVSDTILVWNGLHAYQQTAYRIRMHVDGPTAAYSNWIDVPADTSQCP